MLIVFFEREDVDRRQFCRCIIGVSGVPRGPYCMCKTKMAACALRIKCCVLESCCSFDGSFPSRSTETFKPSYALSKVKNENDAIRNRITEF